MLVKKSQAQELTNILVLQSASMLGLHLNIGSASQLFQQKLLAADIKAGGKFDRKSDKLATKVTARFRAFCISLDDLPQPLPRQSLPHLKQPSHLPLT